MAQFSYGSITITDTTDIERVYAVYHKGDESTAPSLQPLTDWKESINDIASQTGSYIWQRIVTKKSGVAVTASDYSDAVRLTGNTGAALTITNTQYAQTQGENDTPSWQSSMPQQLNEGYWLWVKITYSDNTDVITKIKQGQTGPQGVHGINTATIYLYQRAATQPNKPNYTLTYNFSEHSLTGTFGSWSQSIGSLSGTNPIWITMIVVSSSENSVTIAGGTNSAWSTPTKLAENGAAGYSQVTFYIYKRSQTAITTAPSQTSYNFYSQTLTIPSNWFQYIPTSDGNPCYVSYATARGISTSDTAVTLTWSTPTKLVEDGSDAASITQTRELYYLKTNSNNPSQISWNSSASPPGPNITIYSDNRQNNWTSVVPTYVLNGIYYTCTETSFSDGTKTWSVYTINNALTDMNYNAYVANSIATSANESSYGALSISTGIRQHFFRWEADRTVTNFPTTGETFTLPAGNYMAEDEESVFKAGPQHGYLLTRSDGVWLASGAYRLAALTGAAFAFYRPNTHLLTANNDVGVAMKLTGSALEFYDNTEPPNVPNIIASFGATTTIGKSNDHHITLNSTGMQIYKGGTASSNIIASFSDTITIGKSSTQHVTLNSNGIQLYNSSGALRANIASTTVFYGTSTQVTISGGRIKIGKDEGPNPWTGDTDEYTTIGISSNDGATYINCAGSNSSSGSGTPAILRLNDYQTTSDRANLICGEISCCSVCTTDGYIQENSAQGSYEDLIRLADNASTLHIYEEVYAKPLSTKIRTVVINDNGTLGYSSSSRRWKTNIRYLTDVAMQYEKERILKGIRDIPVSIFNYKPGIGTDLENPNWNWDDQLGLIAEDVANYLPEAADYNPDDKTLVDSWQERIIIPAILLLAQESMNRVEELEQEIKRLKGEE